MNVYLSFIPVFLCYAYFCKERKLCVFPVVKNMFKVNSEGNK